ncbi:hypothetical protein L596_023855 [Steinernema carpocapsae]|uniref:non-specific serine/threonine protein kinase n=1 Tax=Steinernema carpocapsae TaxID=34508 RepID=A0A4U5MEX2_STECR|nr:hypothetical protein L596_023855 [Steinernema carpocapsae]
MFEVWTLSLLLFIFGSSAARKWSVLTARSYCSSAAPVCCSDLFYSLRSQGDASEEKGHQAVPNGHRRAARHPGRRLYRGEAVRKGGFGTIYEGTSNKSSQKVVIKIEPAENGPLFTEISVFIRCLKPAMVQAWRRDRKLDFVGLPEFLGSGMINHAGFEMRFLAMPKYACSMENRRAEAPRMDAEDVLKVTNCMLVSLEYLHANDFVHADIKADNILMEDPIRFDRSILVDFGLARRIPTPKEKADPKKAHNGTAIFTSIDAHRGCAPSYRGDIEILAYNVIYWLTGGLPWQSYETQLERVADAKRKLVRAKLHGIEDDCGLSGPLAQFAADLFKLSEDCSYEKRPEFSMIFKLLDKAAKLAKSGGIALPTSNRRRTRVSMVPPPLDAPIRRTPAAKAAKTPLAVAPTVPTPRRSSTIKAKPANKIIPGLRSKKYMPKLTKTEEPEKDKAETVKKTTKKVKEPKAKEASPTPSKRKLRSESSKQVEQWTEAESDLNDDAILAANAYLKRNKRAVAPIVEERGPSPPKKTRTAASASRSRRIVESSEDDDSFIASSSSKPKRIVESDDSFVTPPSSKPPRSKRILESEDDVSFVSPRTSTPKQSMRIYDESLLESTIEPATQLVGGPPLRKRRSTKPLKSPNLSGATISFLNSSSGSTSSPQGIQQSFDRGDLNITANTWGDSSECVPETPRAKYTIVRSPSGMILL